jgi:ABC-type nitrate/sulfonate/bicarbonate transport system substrate-binding protein
MVTAKKRGYGEIYDMLDMGVEIQGNGFATSRSYIKAEREIVKGALKGYVEAIYYIYHNKEGTKKIIAKYLRNSDPDVLEAAHQGFVKMVPKKPYPTLKGIQFLLDQFSAKIPQAKSAKPEQFVDLSLLQDLEREGFFAELAKRYR